MAESIVQVNSGSGPKLHSFQRVIGANAVEDEVVLLGENYLASYVVPSSQSAATANSHLLQIMAGASLKVRIRQIEIWQNTAITTAALCTFQLFRLTTAGTGGGVVTPNPLDPSDSAAGATAMTLPTVKGTEGAQIGVQSRYAIQTVGASTYSDALLARWDFDKPRSKPLIILAGTTNGICVKNTGAYAGMTVLVVVQFDEGNFS